MLAKKPQYTPVPETFSFSARGAWVKLTPDEMLLDFSAVVLEAGRGTAVIAARNPQHYELEQYAKQQFPGGVTWHTLTDEQYFDAVRHSQIDLLAHLVNIVESGQNIDTRIPRLVSLLLQYAIQTKASDIHIEPCRHNAIVRLRIDGELREVLSLPPDIQVPLVARIKILSNLKTDETRRPQDGRFEPEGCPSISLRVSVMPTLYGEKVVMRILNESAGILTLEQLGFTPEQQEVVKRNMDKPYGMVIASGPTGSGKTTTLYSFLSLLHTKTQNVVTLEDPVESGLERVNQSQVRPDLNFTFATGLRALLRQDPDVMLVGEIRDVETVSMAAQASMTGHLVLTSLHTNDAVGAFARFAEMGVDDFLTASVINLVVAQRLVRTLCTHCSKKEKLDPVIVKRIKERSDVCDALKAENPDVLADLGSREFETKVGCDECMGSGYRGRIGLFELLEMNKDLHDLILTRASSDKMQDVALKHGFETMVLQGVRRVLAGQTTFDEVLRVTREA
jgi:type II secretory ATPase GspE/PulE/Tfp pilus assembly ATPase PilB-like protein